MKIDKPNKTLEDEGFFQSKEGEKFLLILFIILIMLFGYFLHIFVTLIEKDYGCVSW